MEFTRTNFRLPESLVKDYNNTIEKYNYDEKLYINCLIAQELLPKEEALKWIKENYSIYLKNPVELRKFSYEKELVEKFNCYILNEFLELMKKNNNSQNMLMTFILMYEYTLYQEYIAYRHGLDIPWCEEKLIKHKGKCFRLKPYDITQEFIEKSGVNVNPMYRKNQMKRFMKIYLYAKV